MFITKKHLSRRTFLQRRRRDPRAAVARLDGRRADAACRRAPRRRRPASAASTSRTARRWTSGRRRRRGPASSSPEILKPLEPFRDRVNIVSGLAHPYVAGAGGADVSAGANHTRAAAVFLTGARAGARRPRRTSACPADQVAAQHIGQDTPLPSLELSIEESVPQLRATLQLRLSQLDLVAVADAPLPMQNNPRLVFEKLFGDGSTDARAARASPGVAEPARLGDAVRWRRCRRICRPATAGG